MKSVYGIFIILVLVFAGCKDEKIDSNAFSLGTEMQQETKEAIQNIDKKSYEGLEEIFQDTGSIQSNNKILFLVFGKNRCPYCEKFKEDLKNSKTLQEMLKKDFSPYYINISYEKNHAFNFGDHQSAQVLTSQLANSIYRIQVTPTLIFGDKEGKTIIEIPGYIGPNNLEKVLKFLINGLWKDGKDIKERMQLLQTYLDQ